jgi:pilus assembly protein FimV
MAPPGATVAQTAMALYRSNQDAFIRGDINKLKLGAELSIPTPDELFALDSDTADREFRSAIAGGRVTSTPLTDVTRAAQPADRLQIAAAPAVEAAEQAAPREAPPREAAAEPELGAIQQELLLVQEAGESTRQETDELRARISELEEQLADIRKLLQLRNAQLAQIQASTAVSEAVPGEASPRVAEEAEPSESDEAPGEGAKEVPAARVEAPAPKAVVYNEPEPPAVPAGPDADPAAPESPSAEEGFWGTMPASMLAVAAGVPVLLALLALLVVRRRRRLARSLPPADYGAEVQPVSAGVALGTPTAEPVAAAAALEEGGAVSDQLLTPYSALGEEETGEADVISEADVYIAYGRYREAEALLAEEIAGAPGRVDLKLKLAEAYAGARNGEALSGLMAELREAGADDRYPEQWQRLLAIAEELGAEQGPQPAIETLATRPAPATGAETSPVGPESELDFGGLFEGEPLERRPEATARPAAWESAGGKKAPASEAASGERLRLEVEDLDLVDSAFGMPQDSVTFDGGPPVSGRGAEELDGLEDLLPERSEETGRALGRAGPPEAGPSSGFPFDSLDIAPVGKDSVASDVLSSQWQIDSGLWDEVATKIDLARAYIEMEDPDAARAILEEVKAEGNEEQRTEAEEMLSRLA